MQYENLEGFQFWSPPVFLLDKNVRYTDVAAMYFIVWV